MSRKPGAAQPARLKRQAPRLQTHAGEILQGLGEISRGVFVVEAGSVEALVPPSATQAESTDELLYLLTPGDFTDRKSTRLNSSHLVISYAAFCLKKKNADILWITTTATPDSSTV